MSFIEEWLFGWLYVGHGHCCGVFRVLQRTAVTRVYRATVTASPSAVTEPVLPPRSLVLLLLGEEPIAFSYNLLIPPDEASEYYRDNASHHTYRPNAQLVRFGWPCLASALVPPQT